jgi:ABC-type antimicrobial peptide transport system permease subunit
MFKNYLITAFRNLVRNKIHTLINIAGLTVSIACCIFIFVFIKSEKTFDSFHSRADHIYRIVSDEKGAQGIAHNGYQNFAIAKALRNDFPNLTTVTQVNVNQNSIIKINTSDNARKTFEESEVTYADEFFLTTFDYKILAGSANNLLSTPDEVVLTKQLADKFFGKDYENSYDKLIGKTITVNKNNYKISAVLQDIPRNTNIPFKVLLPFKDFFNRNPALVDNWKEVYSQNYTFVTLPNDYTASQFEASLVPFKNKYLNKQAASAITYHAQPLAKVHTDELYGGTLYATPSILITAFLCMGIIVLLTACINFINLATVLSLKRAKEVGIRKTLGSRKWQLMLQFMCETFIVTTFAAVIGVLVAREFLAAFNNYLSFVIDLGLHIDRSIIYFLAALIILITILAGYYPARTLAGYNAIKALKHSISAKGSGFNNVFSLRKILVVTQFAVSQLLIIGTIVVATQMNYFYSRDLGYKKDGILTVDIPENDEKKLALFRNQLLSQPSIEDVSFNSGPPTSATNSYGDFRRKDMTEKEKIGMERKFVDPGYLTTYDIKLLAGRNLYESDKVKLNDSASSYNVVVNKKAITSLGFKNASSALNQTVVINERDNATIVGITEDFQNVSLQRNLEPVVLFYGTNWVGMAAIKLNDTRAANALPFIQKSWQDIFPDYFYKAQPLSDYFKYRAFYIIEDIMFPGLQNFCCFIDPHWLSLAYMAWYLS